MMYNALTLTPLHFLFLSMAKIYIYFKTTNILNVFFYTFLTFFQNKYFKFIF